MKSWQCDIYGIDGFNRGKETYASTVGGTFRTLWQCNASVKLWYSRKTLTGSQANDQKMVLHLSRLQSHGGKKSYWMLKRSQNCSWFRLFKGRWIDTTRHLMCQLTPQMLTTDKAGPGQSQNSRTLSMYPIGRQSPKSSSITCCLQELTLAGWIESKAKKREPKCSKMRCAYPNSILATVPNVTCWLQAL